MGGVPGPPAARIVIARLRKRSVLLFFARFFVLAPVCLGTLWVIALPYYVEALGQCSGITLKYALGRPIDSIDVRVGGLFNTDTQLVFQAQGRKSPMAVTELVTNLATYAALALATGGLTWKRRAKVTLAGLALLSLSHVLYVVLTYYFAAAIAEAIEVPMALAQFFIMAPFLLWIALVYWEQLGTGPAQPESNQTPRT